MQGQNQNTVDNGQKSEQEKQQGRVPPRRILQGGQGKSRYGLGAQKLTGNIPNRPPPSSLNKQILANIKKPPAPLPAISPKMKTTNNNIQKEAEIQTTVQKKDGGMKEQSASVRDMSVERETIVKEQQEVSFQKEEIDFNFQKAQTDLNQHKQLEKEKDQVNKKKDDEDIQIKDEATQKSLTDQSKNTSQNSSLNTSLNEWLPSSTPTPNTEKEAQPDPQQTVEKDNNMDVNIKGQSDEVKNQSNEDDSEEFDPVTQAILKAYEAKVAQEQSLTNQKSAVEEKQEQASFFDDLDEDVGEKTQVSTSSNVVPTLQNTNSAISQVPQNKIQEEKQKDGTSFFDNFNEDVVQKTQVSSSSINAPALPTTSPISQVSQNKIQEDDASFFDNLKEDVVQNTEVRNASNIVPTLPTTSSIGQVSTSMLMRADSQEQHPTQLDKFLSHAAYQASNLDQHNQFNKMLNQSQFQGGGDLEPPTDLFTPTASSRTTATVPDSKDLHLDALKGALRTTKSPESHEFFSSVPPPSSAPPPTTSQPPPMQAHGSRNTAYREYWKQYYGEDNVDNQINPKHTPQLPQNVSPQNQSYYSHDVVPQSLPQQPDSLAHAHIPLNQMQSVPQIRQNVPLENLPWQVHSSGSQVSHNAQFLPAINTVGNISYVPQSTSQAPYLQQLPSRYQAEVKRSGSRDLDYTAQNQSQQQQQINNSFEQISLNNNNNNSFQNVYSTSQAQQQQSGNFFDSLESQQVQQKNLVGAQIQYQGQNQYESVQQNINSFDNTGYSWYKHQGTVNASAGHEVNQYQLQQEQNMHAFGENPHQQVDYVSQYSQEQKYQSSVQQQQQQQQQWDPNYQFQYMSPIQNPLDAQKYMQQSSAQFYQHMATSQSTGYGASDQNEMQQQHQSFPPKSMQEAMSSNAGRPPVNFVTFGFGGKMVTICPFPQSPQECQLNAIIYTSMHQYFQFQTFPGAAREIMESEYACIQAFVGPLLGSSFQKDRLIRYIQERAERCQVEEFSNVKMGDLSILWKVLGFMVKTGGRFGPSGKKTTQNQSTQNQELIDILLSDVQSTDVGVSNPLNSQNSETNFQTALQQLESQNQEHKNVGVQSPVVHESQYSIKQQYMRQVGATSQVEQFLVRGQLQEALECAINGQVWGVALLIARFCGEQAFKDTAWKMSQSSIPNGTPLHSVCSLLSGQGQQIFREDAINACAMWKQNLAAMAMNRIPGDLEAMEKLGKKLWSEKGEICATHTCLVMARKLPEFYDPNKANSTFILLGCNHRSNPRSMLSPLSIQRTEIYEYIQYQLQPDVPFIAFLPHKIIYINLLLEYGLISEAAKYCHSLVSVLGKLQGARSGQGVTAGVGGSLQLWWMQVQELQNRIQGYVGAHGMQVSHKSSTLFGGLGRLIEKGIDHIVGGSKIAEQTQQQAGFHRRSSSGQIFDDSSQGRPQSQANTHPYVPQPEVASRGRSPTSSSHSLQQTPSQQPPSPQPITDTSIQSGWISRFLGLGNANKNNPQASPQEEVNMYYYNTQMGRWVERGKENEVQEEPVLSPPPSTLTNQQGGSFYNNHGGNSANIGQRYVNTFRPASPGGSSKHSNKQTSQFRVPRPPRPNSAPQKAKQSGFLRPGSAGTTENTAGSKPEYQFGYQQFNTQQQEQLYGQIQPIQGMGSGQYAQNFHQTGQQDQGGQFSGYQMNNQDYQSVYQGMQGAGQQQTQQFDSQGLNAAHSSGYPLQEMENLQL